MTITKHRACLKWAGGKKKLVPEIQRCLPKRGIKRLIEPFVGGASVSLNTDYPGYVLNDMNPDLVGFYQAIQTDVTRYIDATADMFSPENNTPDRYYEFREEFNKNSDTFRRACLFLYLNRHGFNGLCRYNAKGGYNVPFGRYKKPYFPERELKHMSEKLQSAHLMQGDFSIAFEQAQKGDVIYCDPPYTPLTLTAHFTAYAGNSFSHQEQLRLVECAKNAQTKGITTVISNHDIAITRELYADASRIKGLKVHRSISRQAEGRVKVRELLAIYSAI